MFLKGQCHEIFNPHVCLASITLILIHSLKYSICANGFRFWEKFACSKKLCSFLITALFKGFFFNLKRQFTTFLDTVFFLVQITLDPRFMGDDILCWGSRLRNYFSSSLIKIMLTLHGIIAMHSWATLIISRVLFLILLDRWQSFSQPCSDKVQSIMGNR